MSYHGPTYSDDLENYFARLNISEGKEKCGTQQAGG